MRVIIIIAVIFLSACAVRKPLNRYQFPEAMAGNVRIEYQKMCEKGEVLYSLNCARCHNTIVKRQTIIPAFSEEQLKGYELRVINREHEANMPDEAVTAEELVLISTFLMYREK